MIETRYSASNGRPLSDLLGEIKNEAVEFLATRLQMFASEMHENYVNSKKALVYGLLAFTLLATGYLLLTMALVDLIAVAFWGNPYAWFLALLIVGLVWSIGGAVFAIAAKADFRGFTPRRTIQVLKADKSLFASEATNQT